ncbi:hypothetical protein Hypma_002131 [Hypsizygus marmoreus]|uniref:Malate dehydrogenase n=1 Tax=Hypsizygus marmoreus TaxID=39966 RepID=A0A369K2N2_HYPMA|nr:hypothetical protein Hypma_002131 [Hypsizygus marmoreus]
MLATTLLSLLVASSVFAAPSSKHAGCDISKAKISFPLGQTLLETPTAKPSYIAVAIGTQNYTCSASGTYTNVGAVAELFDASCIYGTPFYSTTASTAYTLWKIAPPILPAQAIITLLQGLKSPLVLGQHFYVTNPLTGIGINPKWDFTSQGTTKGNTNAYVVAAKVQGMAAPTGTRDIDWVQLKSIQGSLATQVYRVDTKGGQPPASCTPGTPDIAVKYASMYWLFGSSI